MRKLLVIITMLGLVFPAFAQPSESGRITVTVNNVRQQPLHPASVQLLKARDSSLVATGMTDSLGKLSFDEVPAGNYHCRITMVDHLPQYSGIIIVAKGSATVPVTIELLPAGQSLKEVTVSARKPIVKFAVDKTIVLVDNMITNTGATVMEVLEKSPGISVDRDGNIMLKGKPGVLVLIDGKPTYLSGAELGNLLGGMNASQIEQIELIDNPPSRYDAAGAAGVINIRTKKIKQRGFSGSVNSAWQQGRKRRSVHNLALNYRNGPLSAYFNYSLNEGSYWMDLYAIRKYFGTDDKTIEALLEQPTIIQGKGQNHTLKAGLDYAINKKTSVGLGLTGFYQRRNGDNLGTAKWLDQNAEVDSMIRSESTTALRWRNLGVNINARHSFNANEELSADFDWLRYSISNAQQFDNYNLTSPAAAPDAEKGKIPTRIDILSGKADYTRRFEHALKFEAGWKSSRIHTNNEASYQKLENGQWEENLAKTNEFVYTEQIHAAYTTLEKQWEKFTVQAGLRYEYTGYDALQSSKATQKDSAFDRNYNSLFPTAFFQYKADSNNSFSISGGRRIDRPPFQKLNPFVFIINKYTFQRGNPFILPQYTWNLQASHQYKEWLLTSLSYSHTSDFFSQIFVKDNEGNFYYSDGNVDNRQTFGLSVSVQTSPLPWWTFMLQTDLVHKRFKGYIWKAFNPRITQISANLNNQFRFKKGWSGELTAYYITRAQDDLQEVVEPTGQVGMGASKLVLKGKGTIKFTVRDLFWSQQMAGLTEFLHSEEYFKIKRDSRVAVLSFTWRFGKQLKGGVKRSGGAEDEMQRVGTGS